MKSLTAQTLVASLMFVSVACSAAKLASARSALMASLDNLKVTISRKLDVENANCQRGDRGNCQDALLTLVELNTVNSEIALRKLERSVRSGETKELIDDAIDKLSDVTSTVDEIQDKLDE